MSKPARPDYCPLPDDDTPEGLLPCPACGATIDGNDPVSAPDSGPSERWLRSYAEDIGVAYRVLLEGARIWVETSKSDRWGEMMCFGGQFEGAYIPDEFWEHYEAVTGEAVPAEHKQNFLTCSC